MKLWWIDWKKHDLTAVDVVVYYDDSSQAWKFYCEKWYSLVLWRWRVMVFVHKNEKAARQ